MNVMPGQVISFSYRCERLDGICYGPLWTVRTSVVCVSDDRLTVFCAHALNGLALIGRTGAGYTYDYQGFQSDAFLARIVTDLRVYHDGQFSAPLSHTVSFL